MKARAQQPFAEREAVRAAIRALEIFGLGDADLFAHEANATDAAVLFCHQLNIVVANVARYQEAGLSDAEPLLRPDWAPFEGCATRPMFRRMGYAAINIFTEALREADDEALYKTLYRLVRPFCLNLLGWIRESNKRNRHDAVLHEDSIFNLLQEFEKSRSALLAGLREYTNLP